MQDVKITKAIINERKELVVGLLIKELDYTEVEAELLRQSKNNGDMLDLRFTGLTNGDIEKVRKEKVQKLAYLMDLYCEKSNTDLENEKKRLYTRNKVNSRADLTDSQLDSEIDLYILGLREFNG